MIEVEVRQDQGGHLGHVDPDGTECVADGGDSWVVPLVDERVSDADSAVHEDRPVGVSYEPRVDGERLEGRVRWMPIRYRLDDCEQQPLNTRHDSQRHTAQRTPRTEGLPPPPAMPEPIA